MVDYRVKLIHALTTLKNYADEHSLDMAQGKAKEAYYKVGEVWSILERRKGGEHGKSDR